MAIHLNRHNINRMGVLNIRAKSVVGFYCRVNNAITQACYIYGPAVEVTVSIVVGNNFSLFVTYLENVSTMGLFVRGQTIKSLLRAC